MYLYLYTPDTYRWLVQDCSNSIAKALELLRSCTKPLCRATNPSPSEGLTRAGCFMVAVPSVTLLLLLTQKFISRAIPEIVLIFKDTLTSLPCWTQVYLLDTLAFSIISQYWDGVGGWSFLLCHAISTIRRWVTSRIDSWLPDLEMSHSAFIIFFNGRHEITGADSDSDVIIFHHCVCLCLCLSRCLFGRFNYERLVPHKHFCTHIIGDI